MPTNGLTGGVLPGEAPARENLLMFRRRTGLEGGAP